MIRLYIPKKLKKVQWVKNKNGWFPKINTHGVPNYKRNDIRGCNLYWAISRNLFKEFKSIKEVNWASSEYPYYYRSIEDRNKDGEYRLVPAFGDVIIIYKSYSLIVEIDEQGPHDKNRSDYYPDELTWHKRINADNGKDIELWKNGIISLHVSEEESYDNFVKEVKKVFKKIDKYEESQKKESPESSM